MLRVRAFWRLVGALALAVVLCLPAGGARAQSTSCPPGNEWLFGNNVATWDGLSGSVTFAVYVSKAYTPEGLSLRFSRASDGVELRTSVRTAPVDAGDYWVHSYTWNTAEPGYDYVGRLQGRCRSNGLTGALSSVYAEFTTANFATPTPTATATATATSTMAPSATATATATEEPTYTPTMAPSATATATATEEPTYTPTAAATGTPTVDVSELVAAVNRQTAVQSSFSLIGLMLLTTFGFVQYLSSK